MSVFSTTNLAFADHYQFHVNSKVGAIRNTRHIAASTLCAVALSTGQIAFADDSPPTTPELTLTTYSDTATEIFWTRSVDDTLDITYALTRNGQLLFSGDGLSYFDGGLSKGESYIYEVVATGSDGLSTTPASITLQNGELERFVAPVTPTGFRASVYSDTTLELFWDRMGDNVTYFYYQDGALLGLTDGTSALITSDIGPGGTYNFEVQTRLELPRATTVSDRSAIQVTIANSAETAPSVLSGLSLSVYSQTAAELFWERPTPEQRVAKTEIFRDGQLIGETAGTSFYDDMRMPDDRYRYELVAVNDYGLRSDITSIEDTSSDDPLFRVTEANVEEVVFNIAQISKGIFLEDALERARKVVGYLPVHPELSLVSVITNSLGGGDEIVTSYSCPNGGSVVSTEHPTGGLFSLTSEIDQCDLDSERLNGTVDRVGLSWGSAIQMSEFEIIDVNGERTVVSSDYSTNLVYGGRYVIADSYQYTDESGVSIFVNDHRTRLGLSPVSSESIQEIAWSASAPFSDYVTLTANTEESFSRFYRADIYPAIGILEVVTDEGLTFRIDANTGDVATFNVIVDSESDEAPTVFTLAWTDRTNVLLNND